MWSLVFVPQFFSFNSCVWLETFAKRPKKSFLPPRIYTVETMYNFSFSLIKWDCWLLHPFEAIVFLLSLPIASIRHTHTHSSDMAHEPCLNCTLHTNHFIILLALCRNTMQFWADVELHRINRSASHQQHCIS